MTQYRDPKKVCSRIGLALFAMLVAWQTVSTILQAVLLRSAAHLLRSDWSPWLLNSGPLYLVGLPVFLLILHTIPDGPIFKQWRFPFRAKHYFLAMVFCFGATYLISIVANGFILILQAIFGGGQLMENSLANLLGQSSFLPNFVFGVVVPAVGEEFIFRYMLRRKLQGCSDIIYIFFSGLCFALFHANLTQTLFAFVAGSMFAWAYLATDNFLVPVSMHFLLNIVGVLVAPQILQNSAVLIIVILAMISLIIGAIILFFGKKAWFFSAMHPPTESGWPYRPLTPKFSIYSPYSSNQTAYSPQRSGSIYAASYIEYVQQAARQGAADDAYPRPLPPQQSPYSGYNYAGQARVPDIALKNLGMILFMSSTGLLLLVNLILSTVI